MSVMDDTALRILVTFLLGIVVLEVVSYFGRRMHRFFKQHDKNKEQEMEKWQ